jgi:microcystin-dependent protein
METYLGQILMVGFNFAPKGWALCNGQLLPIYQNQALFSLLGTYYGGDGRTTFALPNLQGRVPVHQGNNGSGNYVMGASGGVETVALGVNNLPSHNHAANCSTTAGSTANPTGHYWAEGNKSGASVPSYAPTVNAQMASAAIGATGGNVPVSVVQPYLCVNFIIALQGIYPTQT